MPPPTATAGHAQEEAMDLSVVLQLLKKGIVLIPLTIMVTIFIIRKVLVFDEEGAASTTKNNLTLIVGDQNFHHTARHPNETSSISHNLTFRDIFQSLRSEHNDTLNS